MNRRILLKMAGLFGFAPVMAMPSANSSPSKLCYYPSGVSDVDTFEQLKAWLDGLPNEQYFNERTAYCKATGKLHRELFVSHLSRPEDVKIVEHKAATEMKNKINNELMVWSERKLERGEYDMPIYWRIPLEWEITDAPQVVQYCDDGPDMDYITDQKCVMDHNWKVVKAYCRFSVAERVI